MPPVFAWGDLARTVAAACRQPEPGGRIRADRRRGRNSHGAIVITVVDAERELGPHPRLRAHLAAPRGASGFVFA